MFYMTQINQISEFNTNIHVLNVVQTNQTILFTFRCAQPIRWGQIPSAFRRITTRYETQFIRKGLKGIFVFDIGLIKAEKGLNEIHFEILN